MDDIIKLVCVNITLFFIPNIKIHKFEVNEFFIEYKNVSSQIKFYPTYTYIISPRGLTISGSFQHSQYPE